MNRNKVLLSAFGAVLFLLPVSCIQKESIGASGTDTPQSSISTKVVRLGDEYDRSSVLVKFSKTPDEGLLQRVSKQALSVEPLFNSVPAKKALEQQFGLDRWYIVNIADEAEFDKTVSGLCEIAEVSAVEYCCIAKKASDCTVFPYNGSTEVITKAVGDVVAGTFNDPMLVDQWHYNNTGNASIATNVYRGADINVKDVWSSLTCGDPDIIVAVVDEGVKYTHPDLSANMWVNESELNGTAGVDDDGNGYVDDIYGYNFAAGGAVSWGKDGDVSHGTHCAGTIAAVNNNGIGVSGVAGGSGRGDGCRIMSCQIFSGNTGGSVTVSSRAIKYAADNGASIISCSFGYSSQFASDDDYVRRQGSSEIDAIHYFEASGNNPVLDGNIAIFAAGNESHSFAHYPGAYHDIISVSAFGPDYLPAYYTNYGPGCNITAPGGEYYLGPNYEKCAVLSTLTSENKNTDYGYMQGTSMACPHVSGVVALGLSYAKKLGKTFTRERFKEMILASANDIDTRIGATQQKTYYKNARPALAMAPYYHRMGTGSIDAWKLMMNIEGIPCLLAETGRKQWLDISDYFGSASVSLTYLSVEVSDADKEALGLAENPEVKYGRLYVHPTKAGAGKIKITAVGGGSSLGGGSNPPGGMAVTQEISIISRSFKSDNGGWL